jgi:hypothetical protein
MVGKGLHPCPTEPISLKHQSVIQAAKVQAAAKEKGEPIFKAVNE